MCPAEGESQKTYELRVAAEDRPLVTGDHNVELASGQWYRVAIADSQLTSEPHGLNIAAWQVTAEGERHILI